MVEAKCKPGSLASTICCLCCMYIMYRPAAAGRAMLKSQGIPVPLNVTLMICCLSCCMSSLSINVADCGLQYTGLKHRLEVALGKKTEQEKEEEKKEAIKSMLAGMAARGGPKRM